MAIDALLIPDPILDPRTERERIAARIHRSIGNLTVEDAEDFIAYGETLKALLEGGDAISNPLLPEFSSAQPPEAHIVLLTSFEKGTTETLFRFNQVPNKVRIAELRLLGIEIIGAAAASCTLQFTKTPAFLSQEITIPAGTEISTLDFQIRVATQADLVIAEDVLTGTVLARATVEGDIGRLPIGSLGLLTTAIPGIESITNTTALTGGRNAESPDQAKVRAREEMRIGEHLGSADDWTIWIFFEELRRKGRVTAFEGYLSNFEPGGLGYLLLIVQGDDGLAPSEAQLDSISALITQRHVAGLLVSARGPEFYEFDLRVDVKVSASTGAQALIDKATSNLRTFFDPIRFDYGPASLNRFIGLSDIVGQIEAAGPNLISVQTVQNRFAITITHAGIEFQQDIALDIGELPLLGNVTLNVGS